MPVAATRWAQRFVEDAKSWMPTADPAAQRSIAAFVEMAARTGDDPILALRGALERWFGSAAQELLPRAITTTQPVPGSIALEPLTSLRRPTLWPQRPKRFADELFSSWLWRTGLAAGVRPDRFAVEALGARFTDPDAEASEATLRRLALLSGQSPSSLTAGTLSASQPITRMDVVLDALLRHGRFLLGTEPSAGRPRPVLQYCPRCLAADKRPYFRRSWRFAIHAICVHHRCRLYDACWRCGALVAPLAQKFSSRRPLCANCGALFARAPVAPASEAVRGQRGLFCLLYYAATCLEPPAFNQHLDALVDHFPFGSRVEERRRTVAQFSPATLEYWFGPLPAPRHRDVMRSHARGIAYGAWFGSSEALHSSTACDVPRISGIRPLSRRKRTRSAWFAAQLWKPVQSARSREQAYCQLT